MRQWLASLMLCVMLLSHGSMGAAVPHAHSEEASQADAGSKVLVHHADEHHDERVVANDEQPSDDKYDHVVHTHVIGHLVPPTTAVSAPPLEDRPDLGVMVAAFRPSRDIAPLLEPPSA